ncbi:MAG: hypothetical protein ACJAYU_001378 [Bradymonadia bacterium]|jgi:hypothetical protein
MTRRLGCIAALSLIACGMAETSTPETDAGTDNADVFIEIVETDTAIDPVEDTEMETIETDADADAFAHTARCEDGDMTREGCETC